MNDYVPFYFSPITAFTYSIAHGNVAVVCPDGRYLGQSCEDQRIFLVSRPELIRDAGLYFCFSNIALNRAAPGFIRIGQDLNTLEGHVNWSVFDEGPLKAAIPDIGYGGACQYFNDAPTSGRMNRRQERMAEFLVRDAVPLEALQCIIVKTNDMKDTLRPIIEASGLDLPIHVNRGCYWR